MLRRLPARCGAPKSPRRLLSSYAVSAFNENHSLYDQVRPEFSGPLIDSFLDHLNISPASRVLEIGAGTGKFTKVLVSRGFKHITAVDPSSGMIDTFKKRFPGVPAVLGSCTELSRLGLGVFDAVFVAQAFHWFAEAKSVVEMREMLGKKAQIGFIWNFDYVSGSQVRRDLKLKCIGDRKYPRDYFVDVEFQFDPQGDLMLSDVFGDLTGYKLETLTDADVAFINSDEVLTRKLGNLPFLTMKELFEMVPWCRDVTKYAYQYDKDVPQYRHACWREVLETSGAQLREIFALRRDAMPYKTVYPYWESRSYITNRDEAEKRKIQADMERILKETVTKNDYIDDERIVQLMGTHAVVARW